MYRSRWPTAFPDDHTTLGVRDRAFLRALVHYDYSSNPAQHVYLPQLKFINKHRDTPFFTLFDYMLVYVEIAVKAVADAGDLRLGAEWLDDVARAAMSAGRMQLHVMRVTERNGAMHWVVPVRTETSTICDGIKQMAAELPTNQATWDERAIVKRIQELIDSEGLRGIGYH